MYGIALEGGGARGAYQIGVWRALRELGIDYRGVAGTSVGALNGAMMVQGDFDKALEIWSEIAPSKVIDINDELYEKVKNLKITSSDTPDLLQHIKSFFRNRGMDTTPLRHLLHQNIDEKRIRKRGMEFGIVTISLSDLTPLKLFLQDIPQGKLIDYLLASASMPVFQRQRIDNKAFLDGGVYDNLPVGLLANKGFQKIIAVRLMRRELKKWEKMKGLCITTIKPSEGLGGMLDFTKERARTNIELGYYDALKVFKGYRGRRYCIDVNRDDAYFLHRLLQVDKERLADIMEGLGAPDGMPQQRLILERLVPLLEELLPVPSCASYQEIVLALLEIAAEKAGMERFKIYRYDQFEREVLKKYLPAGQVDARLPRILRGNELLLRMKREQVLDEIAAALVLGLLR